MGVRRKVVGKSEGKRSLGELRHGWEENKRKGDILLWTRFSGSGWGPVAGFCECCNEPSGFRNGRELFDQLTDK
jgi:hypothetical protein